MATAEVAVNIPFFCVKSRLKCFLSFCESSRILMEEVEYLS